MWRRRSCVSFALYKHSVHLSVVTSCLKTMSGDLSCDLWVPQMLLGDKLAKNQLFQAISLSFIPWAFFATEISLISHPDCGCFCL